MFGVNLYNRRLNVAWDWCISRQGYFGVPFPVWYCKECGEPIFASREQLSVNPLTDKPSISKCGKCGCNEFIPESDVMDTGGNFICNATNKNENGYKIDNIIFENE